MSLQMSHKKEDSDSVFHGVGDCTPETPPR